MNDACALFMILSIRAAWTLSPNSAATARSLSYSSSLGITQTVSPKLVMIPETTWRNLAKDHADRLYSMLEPGMTPFHHPLNSGTQYMTQRNKYADTLLTHPSDSAQKTPMFRALDPKNPVYNFLVDYYGIRGAGSVRRLARWSPCPSFLSSSFNTTLAHDMGLQCLTWDASLSSLSDNTTHTLSTSNHESICQEKIQAIQQASFNMGGIFLENANIHDFGSILHLRGMIPVTKNIPHDTEPPQLYGVLYHPAFLHSSLPSQQTSLDLTTFEWNYSLLRATKRHTPNLHCYGLHEWAMLYQDKHDKTAPSSSVFQSHIPLRVSPEIIAETVRSKGTNCTHFDALRFFSPSALPYNSPPFTRLLQRSQQLEYEQPACVHANMDMFKIALRLQPFIASTLILSALEVALMARRLDVEASPYDVSAYGLGVVPVETIAGRALYKKRQGELMQHGAKVRDDLIQAYDWFLTLAQSRSCATL